MAEQGGVGEKIKSGIEWIEHGKTVADVAVFVLSLGGGSAVKVAVQEFAPVSSAWLNTVWIIATGAILLLLSRFFPKLLKNRDAEPVQDRATRTSRLLPLLIVASISFALGEYSVHSNNQLPPEPLSIIFGSYSGDGQNCTASIDTSKLIDFSNSYHLILLCGITDPTVDPEEDTKISVSAPFNINGGGMNIATPLGAINGALKKPGEGQVTRYQMWHVAALIPKDVDPSNIKRVSDVEKLKGKVITSPVGGWSNSVMVPGPPPTPHPK